MKNYQEQLLEKIANRTATIGIIGLGYVGLPLGLQFVAKDFNVIGFDIDERKVTSLNSGVSYIKHIASYDVISAVDSGLFHNTSDFSKLAEVDAIIICVPTPLNDNREPDMSFIVNTAQEIKKYLRPGQLVTLESTTYPGTTDEVLLPTFSHDDFTVGKDFFLAYSPEREDPNNPHYHTATIPKVVGGVTDECLRVASELYKSVIVQTVEVSSAATAEATKLLENIYRSVNIALVNELKIVFERMGIDVWEVIEAASTKPFGYHPFYPGPGLGGHCIPIDPFYLTWKAREYDINTKFIELAGEINTSMPYHVVDTTMKVLNQKRKAINGSRLLILGAAYKKNVDDMRESPSLRLIELFRELGAEVDYSDPYVAKLQKTRKYNFEMVSVPLNSITISSYDAVILSTNHDSFNYQEIADNAQIIIDTRNAFKNVNVSSGKYFKA